MYTLQIVHGCIQDHMDVCYFMVYPLVNTWMYEAPFGPCVNSIGCTLGLADVCYFSGGLVKPHSYKYPYPSSLFMPSPLFTLPRGYQNYCECVL
jgi:hypothetical protein